MDDRRKYFFLPDEIKKVCLQKEIKIVSFDLFDTLLVRPSRNPTDIFYLLEKSVREKYGLSFVNLRLNAEQEMNAQNADLEEIWNWISQKYRLSPSVVANLRQMEIDLETQVLTIRPDMFDVMETAAGAGKRIIVTSDMYLSKEILRKLTNKKGMHFIEKIYVSCEVKKRKSTGELFDYVLEQEGIVDASEMVHIGDNFHSDYSVPLQKGITAVYYPSIWDDLQISNSPWEKYMERGFQTIHI